MSATFIMGDQSDQIWESHKAIIRDLYLIRDNTLEDVKDHLNNKCHFPATKAQIEYRCKKWNFRKGLAKEEWRLVAQKIQKRKWNDREIEVCIEGIPMSRKKVTKAISRYGKCYGQAVQVSSPRLPEGVTIRTPILTSITMAHDSARMPIVVAPEPESLVQGLIGCIPFMKFMFAADLGAHDFFTTSDEQNIMSAIETREIQDALLPRFGRRRSTIEDPNLFANMVAALLPAALTSSDSMSQIVAHTNNPTNAVSFLHLLLFMVSNKLFISASKINKQIYQWIQRRERKELLRYLLTIDEPTVEAFAEELLKMAVEENDVGMVQVLLNSGLDPHELNCPSRFDLGCEEESLLARACRIGGVATVRVLLDAGVSVDGLPHDDTSPLTNAIAYLFERPKIADLELAPSARHIDKRNDLELVQVLLDAGAKVNPDTDRQPLAIAASNCHLELVQLLLAKGADPNGDNWNYELPVLLALKSPAPPCDIIPVVKLLLKAGADVNDAEDEVDGESYTALRVAVLRSKADLVQLLLDAGAEPSEQELGLAVNIGNINIVKVLLKSGVQITVEVIKEAERIDIMQLLLDLAGEKIRISGRDAAYVAAIRYGATDLASFLSGSGAVFRSGRATTEAIEAVAMRGDLIALRLILDSSSKGEMDLGHSLLNAVTKGHSHVAELLLQAGAGVNVTEKGSRRTPLLAAIHRRDICLSQKLLAAGAWVNSFETSDQTHTFQGRFKYLDDFLTDTYTVLPAAVAWGHHPLIQDIIRAGAEINAPGAGDDEAKTALTVAVEKNDLVSMHLLLGAGADVSTPAARRVGHTALAAAVQKRDLAMIQRLLQLGADPDESALIAAVLHYTAVMQLLLTTKRRRLRYFPQDYGVHAMRCAVVTQSVIAVEILLNNGISPNTIVQHKLGEIDYESSSSWVSECHSPFGTALRCKGANLYIIRAMLRMGANPNAVAVANRDRSEANYALVTAIEQQDIEIVQILLDAGADANSKTDMRITLTPLQAAAKRGAIGIVRLLLDRGADVNATPHHRFGETALQFAASDGYFGIVSLLLDHGACPDAPPSRHYGMTALQTACFHGRIDMVQLLLSAGVQVIGTGKAQYDRACAYATERGYIAVRRLLQKSYTQQLETSRVLISFTDLPVMADTESGKEHV